MIRSFRSATKVKNKVWESWKYGWVRNGKVKCKVWEKGKYGCVMLQGKLKHKVLENTSIYGSGHMEIMLKTDGNKNKTIFQACNITTH